MIECAPATSRRDPPLLGRRDPSSDSSRLGKPAEGRIDARRKATRSPPRSLDIWVGRVCKVARSFFQERALLLQTYVLAPQPDQLLRVASLLPTLAVLSHPSRQQALGNPQLLADLRLRQLRVQTSETACSLNSGSNFLRLDMIVECLLHSWLC